MARREMCRVVCLAVCVLIAPSSRARAQLVEPEPHGNLWLEIAAPVGFAGFAVGGMAVGVWGLTCLLHPDGCVSGGLVLGAAVGTVGAIVAAPFAVFLTGYLTGGKGNWIWTLVGAAAPWVIGRIGMRMVDWSYEPEGRTLILVLSAAFVLEVVGAIIGYRVSADFAITADVRSAGGSGTLVYRGQW